LKLYAQAFGLFLISTCAARAASAQVPAATRLDPNAPYSAEKRDPVKYRVDFRAVVTAPYGTKVLRVWLPIPPSDNAQIVEKSYLESFPQKVRPSVAVEKVFGNRFAYFEFPDPRGAQMITHRFEITVRELRYHVAPEKVSTVAKWPEEFTPFLRSESQAVVINDSIRALAGQIVPAAINPLADLKKVIGWVDSNLRYDHSKASLHASSEWALEERAGHCSDYHGLCSAFARTLGYPARVTYGINTFAKNSPSHCKLEVYLPGYDWVSFDVSETQRLCAKIAADASLTDSVKESLIARARGAAFLGFP
jgi:transglutaminase-like putative cysteine protease